MGVSSSDPLYVDVTYIGKGKHDGWGMCCSDVNLLRGKLSLSLLVLGMDPQKERWKNSQYRHQLSALNPFVFLTVRQ